MGGGLKLRVGGLVEQSLRVGDLRPEGAREHYVRSQAICGNGGHDNYGRGEKVPVPKVKEIGS
jgi:hypothetical protein